MLRLITATALIAVLACGIAVAKAEKYEFNQGTALADGAGGFYVMNVTKKGVWQVEVQVRCLEACTTYEVWKQGIYYGDIVTNKRGHGSLHFTITGGGSVNNKLNVWTEGKGTRVLRGDH